MEAQQTANTDALPADVRARMADIHSWAPDRVGPINEALEPERNRVAKLLMRARDSRAPQRLRLLLLWEAADLVNRAAIGRTACRARCTHCCHIPVQMLRIEAELIATRTRVAVRRLPADHAPQPVPADYSRPCPFLIENQCSIYAERPLACRLAINVDVDDLLCVLRPECDVQVPWLDVSEFWLIYSEIGLRTPEIADIRDYFQVANGA